MDPVVQGQERPSFFWTVILRHGWHRCRLIVSMPDPSVRRSRMGLFRARLYSPCRFWPLPPVFLYLEGGMFEAAAGYVKWALLAAPQKMARCAEPCVIWSTHVHAKIR